MSFVQIIQDKLERAKHEFVTNSSNSLSNAGPLLVYIEALRSIYNMEVTERLDIDSNHNDLVNIKDAIDNGVKNVNGVVNSGVSTITSSLNTISNKLDNLNKINNKLDTLNTISNKLDNLNIKSQLIIDDLHTANDYLRDANDYLKTIASK